MLHEIGRGANGARALSAGDARALWDAILDGVLPEAMVGAALMAFRFKGETVDEIAALLDAAQDRAGTIGSAAGARLVVLPCYNGARRMPPLAWLVALALRETGCSVLVHGVRSQPGRLATCEVARAAGVPVAQTPAEATRRLRDDRIAFLPIDAWCPPVARVLAMREVLGLRNSAHTAVKLMQPPGTALSLVPVTHADYLPIATGALSARRATALLFRGVDGEPAPHPNTQRTLLRVLDGTVDEHALAPAFAPDPAMDLPASADAATVARWSAEVVAGRRPMPSMVGQLVGLAVETIERGHPPGAAARARAGDRARAPIHGDSR
ncbi:MAG TPA: DNA-binding protein YbiB [Quisquiliibacterium sp.]|nr:DNA-binding protein YbiB [Quisquiliibacterium sp.]